MLQCISVSRAAQQARSSMGSSSCACAAQRVCARCMHTHIYIFICMYIYVYICAGACSCAHAHASTQAHMHRHVQKHSSRAGSSSSSRKRGSQTLWLGWCKQRARANKSGRSTSGAEALKAEAAQQGRRTSTTARCAQRLSVCSSRGAAPVRCPRLRCRRSALAQRSAKPCCRSASDARRPSSSDTAACAHMHTGVE